MYFVTTLKRWNNSWGSIDTDWSLIFTDDIVANVVNVSFFRMGNLLGFLIHWFQNAFIYSFCHIYIHSAVSCNTSCFNLFNVSSSLNGFIFWSERRRVGVFLVTPLSCYMAMSLFCFPVLWLTPVSSCMDRFTSAQAGIAKSQMFRCFSAILLPLVRPLLVL